MAYPLTTAQTHLGELVAEARESHRPVTISEHGKPVAALINIDDLADLEDRAALAAHLTDKAAGRGGVSLGELDAALDRIEAETLSWTGSSGIAITTNVDTGASGGNWVLLQSTAVNHFITFTTTTQEHQVMGDDFCPVFLFAALFVFPA